MVGDAAPQALGVGPVVDQEPPRATLWNRVKAKNHTHIPDGSALDGTCTQAQAAKTASRTLVTLALAPCLLAVPDTACQSKPEAFDCRCHSGDPGTWHVCGMALPVPPPRAWQSLTGPPFIRQAARPVHDCSLAGAPGGWAVQAVCFTMVPAQQSPGGFSLPHKACDTVSLKLLTNAMVMLLAVVPSKLTQCRVDLDGSSSG